MNYLQKFTLLSLLLLPTISYCMEEAPSLLKLEEYPACADEITYDPSFDNLGREIAANFKAYLLAKYADMFGPLGKVVNIDNKTEVNTPQIIPYYDYRNESIAKLLNDYQNSPEQANVIYPKYRAFYDGMNQEFVLSFRDFLQIINYNNQYPLALRLTLQYDYEKALNYAKTMRFKLHSMEEVMQALPAIKKATEEQETFYLLGKSIGDLECNFLKEFGLSVQHYSQWSELSKVHVIKRDNLNNTIKELFEMYAPTVVYKLWKSAYQGYYETLLRFDIKIHYVNTLKYVDVTTKNIQEIESIKNLNEAMQNAKNSSLKYIRDALFCTDVDKVKEFLDSRQSFQSK